MSITGGSCFLDAVVNDSRIVEVIQPAPGIQCRELVLSPKGLGTALVTVYDIGLTPPLSSSAVVIYLSIVLFLQVLVIERNLVIFARLPFLYPFSCSCYGNAMLILLVTLF